MIINGLNLPNIGFIRAKLKNDGQYTLVIYPSGDGPFIGLDGATMVEIDVDEDELRRIDRVAPHLLAVPLPPK